jgi:two-component system, response regulator
MTDQQEILLVDDNPFDAELTVRALRSRIVNSKLSIVKDGEEALDFVNCRGKYSDRGTSNFPNLILLDLKLPKVTGLEVLKELKSNNGTKKIPTVVLTSSKETNDIRDAYSFGANSYIVKPVDFEVFTNIVGEAGVYWTKINQTFK